MSAWIVSKDHIDLLVTAGLAARWNEDWPLGWTHKGKDYALTPETADQVGQMLWRENFRSVNYRYGERSRCPSYAFEAYPGTPDAGVVLKAIGCLEYQSCERPDWEKSEAYAFCQALQGSVGYLLPSYASAPWGIDGRDAFHQAEGTTDEGIGAFGGQRP